MRALEVIELTGEPYSARLPVLEYADPHTVQIGVDIDRRTSTPGSTNGSEMFDAGFVAEVERLLAREGLAEGRTARARSGTAR